MNTIEQSPESNELTFQQQRFCDEYLVSFNAFRAAIAAGYSENTARKGELLHLPKIQAYLKAGMDKAKQRLEVTHDMILRELAKVGFSNMGNYYDERGAIKPMNYMTTDEKAAISYYQISDHLDNQGNRVGEFGRIKLHNKMAALDKIARHTGFYAAQPQATSLKPQAVDDGQEADSKEKRVVEEHWVSEAELIAMLAVEPYEYEPEVDANGLPRKRRMFEEVDAEIRMQRALEKEKFFEERKAFEEKQKTKSEKPNAFEVAQKVEIEKPEAEIVEPQVFLEAEQPGELHLVRPALADNHDGSGFAKILTLSPPSVVDACPSADRDLNGTAYQERLVAQQ